MAVLRRILTTLAAVLIGSVCLAVPASAFPAGLVRAGSNSAVSPLDKTQFTPCPAGTVASGGGGFLVAGSTAAGHVALDRLEPSAAGFTSRMRVVDGFGGNWQLSTDALCLPAPVGYQIVVQNGPIETQIVHAYCPTDKRVIGMGGRINNGNGEVILDLVEPNAGLTSVTVRGTVVAGKSPNGWSVTAFAVCAVNPAGLQLVSSAKGGNSDDRKGLSPICPAGKGLYSIGAEISPGNGQIFLTGTHAISTSHYSIWADEDADGFLLNWTIFGYGICGS
jgi:hypothetical protein